MDILLSTNPALRKSAQSIRKVDASTQALIDTLIAAVKAQKDPEGVGLAAPQIGVQKRVFVALLGGHWVPFINPIITWKSQDQNKALEGCLSFPGIYGEVQRPISIEIKTMHRNAKPIVRRYTKLAARVLQHEFDHLDGILFIDHVRKQEGHMFRSLGKDEKGKDILEEIALEDALNPQ